MKKWSHYFIYRRQARWREGSAWVQAVEDTWLHAVKEPSSRRPGGHSKWGESWGQSQAGSTRALPDTAHGSAEPDRQREPPRTLCVHGCMVWIVHIVMHNIIRRVYLAFTPSSWHRAPKTLMISWMKGVIGTSLVIIFGLSPRSWHRVSRPFQSKE